MTKKGILERKLRRTLRGRLRKGIIGALSEGKDAMESMNKKMAALVSNFYVVNGVENSGKPNENGDFIPVKFWVWNDRDSWEPSKSIPNILVRKPEYSRGYLAGVDFAHGNDYAVVHTVDNFKKEYVNETIQEIK